VLNNRYKVNPEDIKAATHPVAAATADILSGEYVRAIFFLNAPEKYSITPPVKRGSKKQIVSIAADSDLLFTAWFLICLVFELTYGFMRR